MLSEEKPTEKQQTIVTTDWDSEAIKAMGTVLGASIAGATIGDAIAGDKGAIPGAIVGATFGAGLRAYGFMTDRDTKEVTVTITPDGRTEELPQPYQRSAIQNLATLIGGPILFAAIANAFSSLPAVIYSGAGIGLLVSSLIIYSAYRQRE